ncbi:HigA family addiction module antitoxin [Insolitispirillum peregrinum]|uniref:Plasmid maintenance system antidote protein, XRE family n=1 Tax=Insolitispirillum peregrinum TaxID=80876 RepID=A0A1N7LEF5_9PROT|nr:HigA family addiction module antitoxin [Insolitispirillum peregrinum]SIS72160.1 plasmid maintenance system antidote protein, XRE family [Insolitispirillum peregrinum]
MMHGPAIHPGEILREEFLVPLNLSAYAVAKACGIPRTRIERLAKEATPITADTALRLGRVFNTGAEFWMNLQTLYDLNATGRTLDLSHIVPLIADQAPARMAPF